MSTGARELHRTRAAFALAVALVALAAGLGLRLYPPHAAGPGPRLSLSWMGGALALAVASLLAAWIARPRRAPLLVLGLLPLAGAASIAMLLLALLEPAVREVLAPAGLETAGAFTLVVAGLRAIEARIVAVVPRAPRRPVDAKPEELLAISRAELARDALDELTRPLAADRVAAAASLLVALALCALVLARAPLAQLEVWLPGIAVVLVASSAGLAVVARLAARAAALQAVLGAGIVVGRAKDVRALGRVRRWQLDPALLAAPGPVEVVPFADVRAEKLLVYAEALLSSEEGPELASVRLARQGQGVASVGAAALRRDRSLYRGTVEGERWYLGPERAVAELDPRALDPSMEGPLGFLRDTKPIVWIIGTPERGAVGALGIGLAAEPRAKALAQALGATLMPGGPDATRQALAKAAGLTADGPPVGERDATVLAERSPPPSAGLRVRVLGADLRADLDADPGPRVLPADAPRLPQLGPVLAALRRRALLQLVLAVALPNMVVLGAELLGLLVPPLGAAVALAALALAAAPLRSSAVGGSPGG